MYCRRARGLLPESEGRSLAVPLSGWWWNLKATAELSFCPPCFGPCLSETGSPSGQCVEHVLPLPSGLSSSHPSRPTPCMRLAPGWR